MKNFEIVKKSEVQVSSTMYTIKMDNQNGGAFAGNLKVIDCPFENCQTFLIAPFERLCATVEDCTNIMENVKQLRDLCRITRRLCLIDVRLHVFEAIKEHANIYSSMQYLNLTGSQMVTAIIKL